MKRIDFLLDDKSAYILEELKRSGLSKSFIIRKALEEFLGNDWETRFKVVPKKKGVLYYE